jgi:hypothetical protein
VNIDLDDDALPLIVRALEHYYSYLKATNRDDIRYQQIAESLKKKSVSSLQPELEKRKRKA